MKKQDNQLSDLFCNSIHRMVITVVMKITKTMLIDLNSYYYGIHKRKQFTNDL